MINELRILVLNKKFWFGFCLPIILTITLNIGLIFSIPNQINSMRDISNYLSGIIKNDYSIQLLIGLFTVFVVFFTFAQFSYSNRSIPTQIIRKYILEADSTVFYLGIQFSLIILLVWFSFINHVGLHKLNYLLNLIYLFVSALLSVLYFYWLSKNILAPNVFRLILNRLNIDEIISIEQQCYEHLKQFEKRCESIQSPFKVRLSDTFDFLLSHEIPSVTSKAGTVSNISLEELINLFEPYKEIINELVVDLKIGEFIPKREPLPNIKPETVLIKIVPILNIEESKIEALKKFIDDNKHLIETKFTVDKTTLFSDNMVYIRDLMDFYFYSVNETKDEKELINELNVFLIKELRRSPGNNIIKDIGLAEKLFLEFINVVKKNIRNQDLTREKIEASLSFIYAIDVLATKNKSVSLMKGLIDLLNNLLYYIIINGTRFRFYFSTLILYIKENTIDPITHKDLTTDEFLKDQDFYSSIIFKAIDQAILTYYYQILHFNKIGLEEGKKYLTNNGNHLIDFLFPLNQWKPIDVLELDDNENISGFLDKIVIYLASNLLYLSIYIFKRIEDQELPKELLKDIAFSLADNCYTIFKHTKKNFEIINELFYDYNFINPISSIFSQEFELNGIHEYGTYSPYYYDFSNFWIVYSIYIRKRYNVFIPTNFLEERYSNRILLENLLKHLKKIDYEKLASLLGEEYDFKSLATEYQVHIENLLKT